LTQRSLVTLNKDTTNSSKSNFLFSYDMKRRNLYINGKPEDTLAYCPASRNKENVAHLTKTWIKRL
ncbi:hypothetical protein, partial [Bartonella bacilliformis]|uniref:hypothetical protein n=1 Tax=Bartonella bacilliformis TaxID=774 RepID=UPI0039E637A3